MNQQKLLKIFFGAGVVALLVLIGFAVRDVVREKAGVGDEERYKELGLTPEAVATLMQRKEEVLQEMEKRPDAIVPYISLAIIERSLGDTDAAIAALVRAGQIAPTNHLVFGNLANLYKDKEMNKEAEIAYKRALQYGAKELENYIQYADFLRYRFPDRRDDILALYAKGIEALSGDVNMFRSRAAYYQSIGDFAHALEDWKVVLKKEPDNVAVQQEIRDLKARL